MSKEKHIKSTKLVPYTKKGYLVRFKGNKIYFIYFLKRT